MVNLTVSFRDNIGLDILKGKMNTVSWLYRGDAGLAQHRQSSRLCCVDMGPVVQKYRMRRLTKMRPQTKLVPLGSRNNPKRSFLSSEIAHPFFEGYN